MSYSRYVPGSYSMPISGYSSPPRHYYGNSSRYSNISSSLADSYPRTGSRYSSGGRTSYIPDYFSLISTRYDSILRNRSRARRDAALGFYGQSGRRFNLSDDEFIRRNQALRPVDDPKDIKGLKPMSIDLDIESNRESHHTADYEQEELIVRRGQEFTLSVTFSREYNKDTDQILLQFAYGSRPQESKDTLIRMKVSDKPTVAHDWQAVYQANEGNIVKIAVTSPADAIIGRYQIFVETIVEVDDKEIPNRKQFPESFVVILNPWCKDDSVYMADEKERDEYVMNDKGRIWVGTSRNNTGIPWNFGQFEDSVLEAALYLMDKAELKEGARSNPTSLTRCISAWANNCDDDGVLTGCWAAEFPSDCTAPTAWTGSVAIIEEFMKFKRPVRFGQCWVFSGLVTTLLRSMGIPTRSVTNFDSAHDHDGSITIDYHFDEEGEPLSHDNDSVWNFHVWNESYFKRPDLPEGYDGWQAHDATPQEASENVMRCGPAPLTAIKEGFVYFPHDAPFIFAEVNGDKVYWMVKKDGSMVAITKEANAVGHCISTKAVGSNERHDLTGDYKYSEGSDKERASVRRAFRYSSRHEYKVYDVADPDVKFTLKDPEDLNIGSDLKVSLTMKNVSDEVRNVNVKLTAVTSFYTGVPSERVGVKVFNEELAPGDEQTCDMTITESTYRKYLKPDSSMILYMKANVLETKKSYARNQSFQVKKPQLEIEAPGKSAVDEKFSINIRFKNPLNQALTGGTLHVEAPRIIKPRTITIRQTIGPSGEFNHVIDDLSASRPGKREIFVNFSSIQLSGLTGSAEIWVG